MRFAERAARLAGVAAVLAGWRPEEFWRATPAELSTVLEALGGDEATGAGTDDLTRLKEMFPDG
jgi:hypothetical protein